MKIKAGHSASAPRQAYECSPSRVPSGQPIRSSNAEPETTGIRFAFATFYGRWLFSSTSPAPRASMRQSAALARYQMG